MHIRCYLSKNNDKSLRMLIAQCQLRFWALCLLTKSLHFLPEGEWHRGQVMCVTSRKHYWPPATEIRHALASTQALTVHAKPVGS